MEKTIHHGRNVKRLREMFGIKQEAMAVELGVDWNQRKVSILEAKEVIEEEMLDQIAKVLKVPIDAIKNFDEERVFYAIQNNYDNPIVYGNFQYYPNFNPLEKYIEAVDDIKKLNEKNERLYEALLREKDDKFALLEKEMQEK